MSVYNNNSNLMRGMSKLLNNSILNNSTLNNSSYSNQRVTVGRNTVMDAMVSYQAPRTITVDFYDTGMSNSSIFQRNFNRVVETLNSLEPNCQFVPNFLRKQYHSEIPEACIVINNEHCMVNDSNFKIYSHDNLSDFEVEKSAQFLHQSIKLTTNWSFQKSYY